MAAVLGLISAVLFALAATLQQLGQFVLARRGKKVEGFAELFRLILVPVWLLGTVILLVGYLTQGAALDRGKLVVVQPLLVTTIFWALPLAVDQPAGGAASGARRIRGRGRPRAVRARRRPPRGRR
jgi:hypothetical protein